MGVGLRLKEILKKKGITIKELSKMTGIPINTLYSITKRDSERVDKGTLNDIANALNISINELTGSQAKHIEMGGFYLSDDTGKKEQVEKSTNFLNYLRQMGRKAKFLDMLHILEAAFFLLNEKGQEIAIESLIYLTTKQEYTEGSLFLETDSQENINNAKAMVEKYKDKLNSKHNKT